MCGVATLAIVMPTTCSSVAAITPTISSRWFSTGSWATSSIGAGAARPPPRAGRAALAKLPLPAVGEDGDVARQAGDQRPRALLVDRDPYRHSLRHLDPVARGVLRLGARVLRARAAPDRGDVALQLQPAIGGVACFRRLADAQLVVVGLLEVGFDVRAFVGADGHHRQAGVRLLAQRQPVGLGGPARDR